MKRNYRKITSLLMALVLLIGMAPVVSAHGSDDDKGVESISPLSGDDSVFVPLGVANWGGKLHDYFTAVAVAPDGFVYAAALSEEYAVIVKYDSALVQQKAVAWERDYSDGFNSIVVAEDGSIYVAGSFGEKALIVKYDSDLVEQKTVTWGGPHNNKKHRISEFSSLGVATDGSVYAAGYSDEDALILKYDSSLVLESAVTWGGNGKDAFSSLAVASDGFIYAAGSSSDVAFTKAGLTSKGGTDAIIVRFNSDLVQQGAATWSGKGDDVFSSLVVASDGFIYAAGSSSDVASTKAGLTSKGGTDAIIVRFNSDLVQQDAASWGGKGDDAFSSLAVTADGLIYAAGDSSSTDSVNTGFTNKGSSDAVIVKYDGFLAQLNVASWGGCNEDCFNSLVLASDGFVFAVGGSFSTDSYNTGFYSNGSPDAIIVKFGVPSAKKKPAMDQFTYNLAPRDFNAKPQGVEIRQQTGVGKTVGVWYAGVDGTRYTKSTKRPKDAGTYRVTVDVLEGTQFSAASGIALGTLKINRISLSNTKLSVADQAWTGKRVKPKSMNLNGVRFSINEYASVKSCEVKRDIGKGTIRLIGKGSLTGKKTFTFRIVPKKTSGIKASERNGRMEVSWNKAPAAQKITGYQVRYAEIDRRTGDPKRWKIETVAQSKTSTTIKGLNTDEGHCVQVRSYKKVNRVKYYSAWSAMVDTS